MRWVRNAGVVAAVVAVGGLLWANWQAQREMQRKLDALLAREPQQPAEKPPVVNTPEPGAVPRELSHVKLPPYVIEAPDLLLVEAVLKDPKTGVIDRLPTQPIGGQFPVRLDGTIGLGLWGSVAVSGLTIEQATAAVRAHLANQKRGVCASDLQVSVDVIAMNSKRYYVITDAKGEGEQVYALPVTGSETVLDAVAQVDGLAAAAGGRKVWVARRTTSPGGAWQQLPVDWNGITRHGVALTNYQIMPGDRLYVKHASD